MSAVLGALVEGVAAGVTFALLWYWFDVRKKRP